MKISSLVLGLVLVLLLSIEVQAGDKGVGELCKKAKDCASGICVDLHKSNDRCHGKVCSQPCRQNADCPPIASEPDCDPFKEQRLCFYGGWEPMYCGK